MLLLSVWFDVVCLLFRCWFIDFWVDCGVLLCFGCYFSYFAIAFCVTSFWFVLVLVRLVGAVCLLIWLVYLWICFVGLIVLFVFCYGLLGLAGYFGVPHVCLVCCVCPKFGFCVCVTWFDLLDGLFVVLDNCVFCFVVFIVLLCFVYCWWWLWRLCLLLVCCVVVLICRLLCLGLRATHFDLVCWLFSAIVKRVGFLRLLCGFMVFTFLSWLFTDLSGSVLLMVLFACMLIWLWFGAFTTLFWFLANCLAGAWVLPTDLVFLCLWFRYFIVWVCYVLLEFCGFIVIWHLVCYVLTLIALRWLLLLVIICFT